MLFLISIFQILFINLSMKTMKDKYNIVYLLKSMQIVMHIYRFICSHCIVNYFANVSH